MMVKVLGCVWIAAALLLLLKPQGYKEWLKRNMKKRYIPLLPLGAGALLMYVGLQFRGLGASIVVILGIMSILKAAFFLNAKLCNKLMDWALTLPLTFYRIGACIHIGIGALILSLSL